MKNLQNAINLAKAFAENPTDWLVFSGVYGGGKTHLAAAIANKIQRNGGSVLFVVVPDLLDHLRATFNPSSNVNYDKLFTQIKTAEVLILDDLGTESATPWAREKLYQLFNYRYSMRLPTVITTAIAINKIDSRLASRILDNNISTIVGIWVSSYNSRGDKK